MFGRRGTDELPAAPPPLAPAAAPSPALNGTAAPAASSAAATNRLLDPAGHAGADSDVLVIDTTTKTNPKLSVAKEKIYGLLMEQIDLQTASRMPRDELRAQIIAVIGEIVMEQKLPINHSEQQALATQIVDDMLGLGPLEPLLADEAVTDIMVNGPDQVYVERKGKLTLTDVKFRDNSHVMAVATRIVTNVGRRIDETTPLCDARLADGSRVNVIAPPLAIRGTSISIRKFSKKKITLDVMESQGNISHALFNFIII
jgi:pilus assembly protein CpaF